VSCFAVASEVGACSLYPGHGDTVHESLIFVKRVNLRPQAGSVEVQGEIEEESSAAYVIQIFRGNVNGSIAPNYSTVIDIYASEYI